MLEELYDKQIELEQRMTQCSIEGYRRELERAKQNNNFGCTPVANRLMAYILDDYASSIKKYLKDYNQGNAVKSTIAADVIGRLADVDTVAYISAKVLLNSFWSKKPVQAVYKEIGQAIEDEFKMRECKNENKYYYDSIQKDLDKRGAKALRKRTITKMMFNKRLDFHTDKWSITEKFQAGLVLTYLFIENTGLIEFEDCYRKKKHFKFITPTAELVEWIEAVNENLEVMQPLFLPMIVPPKQWTSIFEGGYLSPYLRRNKMIKSFSKDYLKGLNKAKMPIVYGAINHLQATEWHINGDVLEVVQALWEAGSAIAELPEREDELLIPFPYPDRAKDTVWTADEKELIAKWKRDTYDIHKRNVQRRSIRLSVAQIIRIAKQFAGYEGIYFPYQMDFRGRLYPIPVLLQPQGSDLAKGLLHFAQGKRVNKDNIKWLEIHGANMYGYDKESYEKRVQWTKDRCVEIKSYAENPLFNKGWAEADKPFQFLAFCFEYRDYLDNPDSFRTHIPVQLDGTCNGLQHYSALLRDEISGRAVNLTDTEKPNDIYGIVAQRLEDKLNVRRECFRANTIDSSNSGDSSIHNIPTTGSVARFRDDIDFANRWLSLGINRKLTKRPVMVLPYGGTLLSCREYIEEYLKDNYSPNFLWSHFSIGHNPTDCIFKVSAWLSKYLWEAIQETLQSAITGMAYIKKIAKITAKEQPYLEWMTPVGLLVHQEYKSRKHKEIKTELYGSIIKTNVNIDMDIPNMQRQLNGICPNFIHSLDASCLMLYLIKCKQAGIKSFMTVHDCYGVLAPDTDTSATLLREAFVEVYREPVLANFTEDILSTEEEVELPIEGHLNIEDVKTSKYFFN